MCRFRGQALTLQNLAKGLGLISLSKDRQYFYPSRLTAWLGCSSVLALLPQPACGPPDRASQVFNMVVHADQLEHHVQQKVGDARAWHSAPCQLIAKTKFDQILDLAMRKAAKCSIYE